MQLSSNHTTSSKLFERSFVAVIVIAIVLRLGLLFIFSNTFAFEKTGAIQGFDAYDIMAQNLLKTGVYGYHSGEPDASLAPLYIYLLAGLYTILGRGSFQIVLLNTIFDVITIIALVYIGKHLFPKGRWIGLLSALFFAIYPYFIFQSLTVIDTPLFTMIIHIFTLIMILLRLRTAYDTKTVGLGILGGSMLGLGMLDRVIAFALGIAVFLWFLFQLNVFQTIKRLLPVALTSILLIIPWNIRNYQVFHTFVNIGTHGGMNFWFGNSEYTIPFFRAGYHTQWAKPKFPSESMTQLESDRWLFNDGMKYLREHPEKIPELTWIKILAYWSINIFPTKNPVTGAQPIQNYQGAVNEDITEQGNIILTGIPENDALNTYSQPLFDKIARAVHVVYFGSLLMFAIIGMILTRTQWRNVSLLWFIQLCMTVIYVIFSGPMTRYRVPTDPMLFLFSAYTLMAVWQYWLSRRLAVTAPQITSMV
jgi:hypothetical protein